MSYPAYESYKDSGVEWLGEVPAGWDVERLKINANVLSSNVDKKTIEGELPVQLCNYTDVYYHDKITAEIDFMRASAKPEEIIKFTLIDGDVVITKDSETPDDIGVPTLISEDIDNLICGYHLAILRGRIGEMFGPYLFYAIKSELSSSQFAVMANGVTRFGLSYDAIKNLLVLKPSVPEQKTIATFLDEKTGAIDDLIAKKEKLLELLAEKRTALITQAVTKGLDRTAPMKPSHLDSLGDIPADWEVKRLRFLTQLSGGSTPSTKESRYWEGEYPWVSPKDMKKKYITDTQDHLTKEGLEECASGLIPIGTAMIVVRSGILRHTVPVSINLVPVALNQDMKALVLKNGFVTEYFYWYIEGFKNSLINIWCKPGTTVESIEMDYLKDSYVTLPSVTEQNQIVEFLEIEIGIIDKISDRVCDAISKLQEYRTAIITNAVTGKIKVT